MTLVPAVFSALLGAIVGSFLNACIHRMPRGLSVANPRRSFCPTCQRTIPWFENIPILSWLLLRGRCSGCGSRISARYVFVEALTAAGFYFVWVRHGFPMAVAYWVFVALLIVATFIDIEHFIIPDEITWGGTAAGLVSCLVLPGLMGVPSHWVAGGLSLFGAAVGFGLLWLVVEGGKLAFGRKRHAFDPPEAFAWVRDGDRADLTIGADILKWEEIFSRESDVLVVETDGGVDCDGRTVEAGLLRFTYEKVMAPAFEADLDGIDRIRGRVRSLVIPREAMGFGDVKFIACVGAFLGWQAVLFTLFAASITGCIAGVAGLFLARDKAGTRIPFGPFLALGGAGWIFGGRELMEWYFSQFRDGPVVGWLSGLN